MDVTDPAGPRLGEGDFPHGLDRVNLGAFLLAFLWAPFHRLWAWFAVFVVLEALESVLGLSAPGFLGGLLEQPAVVVGFRVVYWTLTVVFALRANRLVWALQRERGSRAAREPGVKRPPLTSSYVSNQRIWALIGLLALVAMPLFLFIGPVKAIPGAVGDVAVTTGVQAILLGALFMYDRVRTARRRTLG